MDEQSILSATEQRTRRNMIKMGAILGSAGAAGGFRREVQPRRQHWFLNEKSGFPFRTPAFCSVSRGQRRLGEKEYRAPSVTPGVALRPRTQGTAIGYNASAGQSRSCAGFDAEPDTH